VGLDHEFSTFTNHALFVPILYNIALLSQKNYPLFYIIGKDYSIEVPSTQKDNTYHITNKNFDVIPPIKKTNTGINVFVNAPIEVAENYTLTNQQHQIGLAYNYNRSESDLSTFSQDEIENQINATNFNAQVVKNAYNIKSALVELNTGKRYWKYCVILALLFLATEIILIKLFK
jgi:hypothetical protein